MGRASVPTPALYPAFFFVLEKALKSAGNAVISTLLMHRSYGLQGSLKRRYKHPFPASINEYYTAKNGLGTIAPRLLSRVKVGTHTRLCSKDRTQRLTRRNRGLPDGAAITTLGAFRTFTNIPGPGIRTAYFAALGSWPGGAPEERREPAEQRCAYARRCSEASRPRRAA